MQQDRQTVSNRKFSKWLKDAWQLARPYWTSDDKWRAIGLISVVILFNLANVYVNVQYNTWSNNFYDALQQYNKKAFTHQIIVFCLIAFFNILFSVLAYFFQKSLEIRWRRWMTKNYIEKWLSKQAYYKTRFLGTYADNPDQRISEDVNSFIVLTLGLSLGLLTSIVTLCSFLSILWHLSGNFAFSLAGHNIVIPGYVVWVALVYAIAGTWITFKIGRPLIKLDFLQQSAEADFRFNLMRMREYGENIAFYQGEQQEKDNLLKRFNVVVNNFVAIIFRTMKINIFGIGYNQIAIIFPMLVAAPRYFAKAIKLGEVMQILSAFGQVQGSFSYFIQAYNSLSGWRAVMDRLSGFQSTINEAVALPVIPTIVNSNKNIIAVNDLTLNLPDGRPLIKGINFNLAVGERLLIKGKSGSGKTTLLRSIAGLWPFATGSIQVQAGKISLFIAQRPYLPNSNLRTAICYPSSTKLVEDKLLQEVLHLTGLELLYNRLDEIGDWNKNLSLGEQQRLAFCRILLNQPDIVYLDEATSALDEEMEDRLYSAFIYRLPNSTIISIGHRSSLKKWHNQELNFNNMESA